MDEGDLLSEFITSHVSSPRKSPDEKTVAIPASAAATEEVIQMVEPEVAAHVDAIPSADSANVDVMASAAAAKAPEEENDRHMVDDPMVPMQPEKEEEKEEDQEEIKNDVDIQSAIATTGGAAAASPIIPPTPTPDHRPRSQPRKSRMLRELDAYLTDGPAWACKPRV
jgi:hypothetical protein